TGFITRKGFEELEETLQDNIKKVKKIIVGVYTESAKQAYDYISLNHPKIKIYVFKDTALCKDNQSKIKFRPILHAKIIAGYDGNNIVWAYTGSANLTDFALNDKNIESGIWLNNNKILESIDYRIKKIMIKKNILEYKDYKTQITFQPTTDPDIYEIPNEKEKDYYDLRKTYYIKVKSKLNNRNPNKIGLYSKYLDGLKENFNGLFSKVILEFEDNLLVATIITTPGGVNELFPNNDIEFYINRKLNETTENGFFIEDVYNPSIENKFFIILDKITQETSNHFSNSDLDILGQILHTEMTTMKLSEENISIEKSKYKDSIIVHSEKQKIKVDDRQIQDGLFDISKIELISGSEVTLTQLNYNDYRFNNPIRLNKIKTD
ncbi:MAG: NgoFVII family restriction endonuclease, partial [Sphingobacteriales bacterium]|nr:NgoFVII family restriction endonuclease [Sphingobacteriales bacterium]